MGIDANIKIWSQHVKWLVYYYGLFQVHDHDDYKPFTIHRKHGQWTSCVCDQYDLLVNLATQCGEIRAHEQRQWFCFEFMEQEYIANATIILCKLYLVYWQIVALTPYKITFYVIAYIQMIFWPYCRKAHWSHNIWESYEW